MSRLQPKMYKKRAQSSIEFITLMGFMFFIFLVILGALLYYVKLQNRSTDYSNLEDMALRIKQEVQLAHEVNEGYERNFTIPMKINFQDYSLSVVNRDLTLKMGEYEYSLILPEHVGNITKGINVIKKQAGVVYVNT